MTMAVVLLFVAASLIMSPVMTLLSSISAKTEASLKKWHLVIAGYMVVMGVLGCLAWGIFLYRYSHAQPITDALLAAMSVLLVANIVCCYAFKMVGKRIKCKAGCSQRAQSL